MSWIKIYWNAHDQWTLSLAFRLAIELSNKCLFYVCCTSKLDYYILDEPVSNRLITEQGISKCFNFSIVVVNKKWYHSQVFKRDVYNFCGLIW